MAREEELSGVRVEAIESGYALLSFRVELPFQLVGSLAVVAEALASEGVSLLAFSSYSTDHLLVRWGDLEAARRALERIGAKVEYRG